MRTLLALAAALALALALAVAPAQAAAPRASLADLEKQVMCVECGTPLEVSQSPVANQERQFIQRQIAQGKDEDQIKAALVAQYGDQVLADPQGSGFDLTSWLVPIVLVALGLAGVSFAARRWRRDGGRRTAAAGPPLDPDDARRLDAELAAFDR